MSGGAIFGVGMDAETIKGQPKPKLAGMMTDYERSLNEIFGPSMAIILALIRDGWGVSLPARLEVQNIKTHPKPVSKAPASG